MSEIVHHWCNHWLYEGHGQESCCGARRSFVGYGDANIEVTCPECQAVVARFVARKLRGEPELLLQEVVALLPQRCRRDAVMARNCNLHGVGGHYLYSRWSAYLTSTNAWKEP